MPPLSPAARAWLALAGLAGVGLAAAAWGAGYLGGSPARAPIVTFATDVAPIVHEHCAPCHRPGEAGPFSLLSYDDVRKRARQIARVTGRRYMPPWLPAPGGPVFAGERRLTPEQIDTLARWAALGAPEGDAALAPPVPQFVDGWQLGEPDLIVTMTQPYVVPAEGSDVFRNFVIPVPVGRTRFVRAVEIRPGDKKVVHHANLLVDRARSARRADARDPGEGFSGMDLRIESEVFDPESHFLFWKPGSAPQVEPPGMAWRLDPGTDLVLNMHFQPSGKPETIRAGVGLYFTNDAPTHFPMLIQLENDGALDIPAGDSRFEVTDTFELPMDVDVLGIYPHAHYLGRELDGVALLPDGTRTSLIHIPDWDLNWQAVYRYAQPVFLPRGSRITMRYRYDNSADNVRNPHSPPQRVRGGNRTEDEMAHLWLQVLPRGGGDRRVALQEALMRHRLVKNPRDLTALFNLGSVLILQDRPAEAVETLQGALAIDPDHTTVRNSLGTVLQTQGRFEEAIREYRAVLRVEPAHLDARFNLGNSLAALGRFDEAIEHFAEVVRRRPDDERAREHLAAARAARAGTRR